jgi:protein-tyrosine phosphatase
MPDWHEIIDNRVWVGGYIRPSDVPALSHLGISAVVSMQSDMDLMNLGISISTLYEALTRAGIGLFRIPTVDFDSSDLSDNISEAVARLEEALEPECAKAYVHCTAGINRGPTVVAAYLIKTQGFSPREACNFVKSRRYCDPVIESLGNFERSLWDFR